VVTASKISATSVARFFSSQISRGGQGFGLLASEHDAKGPAHLIARTRGGFSWAIAVRASSSGSDMVVGAAPP